MPSPKTGGRGPAGLRRALTASLAAAALTAVLPVAPSAAREATSALFARFTTGTCVSEPTAPPSAPATPPDVIALVDPPLADAYNGWRSRATRIVLIPDSEADVYYAWDSPLGAWQPSTRTLVAPEGKHTLYAFAQSADGSTGPVRSWPIKVDYRARPLVGAADAADTAVYEGTSTASGDVSVRAVVNPAAGPRITRFGGPTRYETSVIVADSRFATAAAVIIATGESFPDALAASGLAGSLRAPILLTRRAYLPSGVIDEIERLSPERIVIVGGTAAVSAPVEGMLGLMAPTVDRLAGATRYETAEEIAEEIIAREGAAARTRVFVARGDLFPDALSLSPYAFAARAPLLLVRPDEVPWPARRVLSGGAGRIVLGGGIGAVGTAVESQLAAYAPVTRLAGADRYNTASVAAAWGVAEGLGSWDYVSIATGQAFPDALCGGAVTGYMGGAMLLTPTGSLSPYARSALASNTPDVLDVDILGGTAAIDTAVEEEIRIIFQ